MTVGWDEVHSFPNTCNVFVTHYHKVYHRKSYLGIKLQNLYQTHTISVEISLTPQ